MEILNIAGYSIVYYYDLDPSIAYQVRQNNVTLECFSTQQNAVQALSDILAKGFISVSQVRG